MCKSLSKAVLLGWSNVKDNNDNNVEFSEENAYIALKNNGLFRNFVIDISSDLENFKSNFLDKSIKS
jgi:hypothetical protein